VFGKLEEVFPIVEFYQGTIDSVMERLCKTIWNFDKSWIGKCIPASDEKIQQLENICSRDFFCFLITGQKHIAI
jgi:hypothetical protein